MSNEEAQCLIPPNPLNGVALDEWNRVAQFVYQRDHECFELDLDSLWTYCQTYEIFVKSRNYLEGNPTLVDSDGTVIPGGAATDLQAQRDDLVRQCEELLLPCDADGRMVIDGSVVPLKPLMRNELETVDDVLRWGDFKDEQQDEPACVEWHRVIPELWRLHLLDEASGKELSAIRAYCHYFALLRDPHFTSGTPEDVQRCWRLETMKRTCSKLGVAYDESGAMVFSENISSLESARRKRKADN